MPAPTEAEIAEAIEFVEGLEYPGNPPEFRDPTEAEILHHHLMRIYRAYIACRKEKTDG